MNILLIDACRDNFFHPKSKIKGFAMMEAGLGTCMALSACPGQTASDQSKDRNSLFAQHLLKELSGPPAPIDQVFKQVKEKVYSASKQAQRPWVFLDTIGDFVFADADAPQTAQSLQIEALIEKGKSEYRAGKFQEAAATLETAYRVDRDNPYLCNALGAARSRINQKSIAVSLFSQAIEKKPDYAAAYFNRGAVLSTVSDRERDAIQDFTWAIEQEPSDARAYDLRGNCYVSISELDLALADFNQALTSNPADAEALLGRGRVSVRRRDNAGAIQDLTESLALKKTYQAYLVRSQAYVAANKANEAAADRKQAELLGPK